MNRFRIGPIRRDYCHSVLPSSGWPDWPVIQEPLEFMGTSIKTVLRFGVLVIAIALSACVSSGVKVDQSKLSSLKPGVTTCTEAVAMFGSPTNTSIQSDGTKSYQYVYRHAEVDAANFIPYVGTFVGGTKSEDTTFTMNCDKHDILLTYSSSQGSNSTGTGIISGQKQ